MVERLLKNIFIEKTDNTYVQFFRYVFVGGIATVADMAVLFVLFSLLNVNYLLAAALGFVVGVAVNYLISIVWVFQSSGNISKELMLFVSIGIFGLLWTEIFMWIFVSKMEMPVMLSKLVVVFLVLLWNFGMRKKFVF